jgi:putative ABC transport system ATP-binding protein
MFVPDLRGICDRIIIYSESIAMELAAEIIDIHKYYFLGDNTVKALNGVSLEIPKGDFVAIMGSSGSGKSTLLNLLGALDRPTKGQYILGGHDVSQLDDDQLSAIRNQMIGFIFQSYNLIAQYTVLENIEVPLHYGANAMTAADRKKCRDLADAVGLGDRLDHRPYQLSGGQQQRVAIARALANDPEIILADEPTGNLDSTTEAEIMDTLRKLNEEGRTIIMVTHENDVARQAKRQIFMKDGVVAGTGIFPGTTAVAPVEVGGVADSKKSGEDDEWVDLT